MPSDVCNASQNEKKNVERRRSSMDSNSAWNKVGPGEVDRLELGDQRSAEAKG